MSEAKIHLVATLRARPDKADELRGLLLGLVEPTRAEAGCLMYELWQSEDDPNEFRFVEKWSSSEALRAHFDTPHIRAALGRFPELLAAELDLRRYELVG